MARPCSICTHPEREAIDTAIAAGKDTFRGIARRFAASPDAIARHAAEHIPELLARARALEEAHGVALGTQVAAQEAREDAHALDVMDQLTRLFDRMNKLGDACDRWLSDPEDPTRYDIGPRSDNVLVTYTAPGPDGKPVRQKALLSDLLEAAQTGGIVVDHSLLKYADPRELAVKVAGQLKGQVELLAKLMGDLQQEGTVTLTLSPEWAQVRSLLLEALLPYPEARTAVATRLTLLESA